MVFPISIGGTIRLKGVPNTDDAVSEIIEKIETLLDDALASTVSTDEREISFTAGLFGRAVWNWNVLIPFGSGRIWVDRRGSSEVLVRYKFSTLQMLAVVSGMMALLALFLIAPQHDFKKVFSTTGNTILLGWLWLFGMNYLIAMIRVPIWLRSSLRKK